MSQSTDGYISFGILLEEDAVYPWTGDEFDDDFDEWYYQVVCGLPAYTIGVSYDERKAYDKEHPAPVKLHNYCSGDYPMYMLIIPGTRMVANRGEPTRFDPSDLSVSDEAKEALTKFCEDHKIPTSGGLEWFISSCWS